MPVITNLFGESPFKAVQVHSGKVHQCVALVAEMFQALASDRRDSLGDIANQIFELETEADHVRNHIHEQLAKTILLPVSKNELFHLIEHQDSIADRAEDIAAFLTYRKLWLPEELMREASEFLGKIVQNCKLAEGVISKLSLLEESSFRGRDALTVSKIISELEEREDETKGDKVELIRKIFSAEEELPPVDLMLWSQIIEYVSDLSRCAENAANGLRVMLEIN